MASPDTLHGLAYVAFQELATRISHRNTGRYSDDPVADRIMVRIAADENLHMVFYRDILKAALAIEPSAAVRAIMDEVLAFEMPGAGIPNFLRKAADIAKAGIYDLRVHRDEVLLPILQVLGRVRAQRARCGGRGGPPPAGGAPGHAGRGREAVRGAAGALRRPADRSSRDSAVRRGESRAGPLRTSDARTAPAP